MSNQLVTGSERRGESVLAYIGGGSIEEIRRLVELRERVVRERLGGYVVGTSVRAAGDKGLTIGWVHHITA